MRTEAMYSKSKQALTVTTMLAAVLFVGGWMAKGGIKLPRQTQLARKPHTVALHWNASETKSVGYNVYRGSRPQSHPDKLNTTPIKGLTFTDTNVQNGKKYYYVTRAIDSQGKESVDSNETVVTIPTE